MSFIQKIKSLWEEEIEKSNREIDKLNHLLNQERKKLAEIEEFMKDKFYQRSEGARITGPPSPAKVRGFPSKCVGDTDDEFDDIRRSHGC